jgi:putative hydrolase of the HAD superfamily
VTSRAPVVLFDLDGTLLDHDRAEEVAIRAWIAAEGWPTRVAGGAVASAWHQITEDAFADYRAGRLTVQGQRRARVRRLLATVGDDRKSLDDEAIDLVFEEYRARYEASWKAFPDVLRCVAAVSVTYRVAVLSNGELAEKVAKVRAIGLDPYVELTMASSDLGFAKPDPRAFRGSLERLGAVGANAVYVGDQLDLDARAANAAGLSGLWLDRKGYGSDGPDVDVIRSLTNFPTGSARRSDARSLCSVRGYDSGLGGSSLKNAYGRPACSRVSTGRRPDLVNTRMLATLSIAA